MSPNLIDGSSSGGKTCENCHSIIAEKDTVIHETECPPSKEKWSHNYIQNAILYSKIESYTPTGTAQNYFCITIIPTKLSLYLY